jgi:hypothetical protein
MRQFGKALACMLLVGPAAAMASGNGGYLDLFYVPNADLELSDSGDTISSDGGAGFGIRARTATSDSFFFQGEYQKNEYDGFEGVDLDTEASNLRLGLGLAGGDSGVYGLLEYVKVGLDVEGFGEEDDTGFGAHVGIRGSGPTYLFGQIGMLDAGDFGNGLEFLIGGAMKVGDAASVVVDYRVTNLEDDDGAEAEFSDLRAGLRIGF